MKTILHTTSIFVIMALFLSNSLHLQGHSNPNENQEHGKYDVVPKPQGQKPPEGQKPDSSSSHDISHINEESGDAVKSNKNQPVVYDKENIKVLGKGLVANFNTATVTGFRKEHLANFDKDAVAGLGKEHLANFDKDAMAGFNKEHIANFDKEAVAVLAKEHVANFDKDAVAGLNRKHISNMAEVALSGLNASQIRVLDPNTREGIGDEVESFKEFSISVKEELVKNKTRRMPGVGSFDTLVKKIKEPNESSMTDNLDGWDQTIVVQKTFSGALNVEKASDNIKKLGDLSKVFSKLNILTKN